MHYMYLDTAARFWIRPRLLLLTILRVLQLLVIDSAQKSFLIRLRNLHRMDTFTLSLVSLRLHPFCQRLLAGLP